MGDLSATTQLETRQLETGDGDSNREVTVLVTGFGPFLPDSSPNPSHQITTLLPRTLRSSGPSSRPIRLLIHPDPIKVAYHPVYALAPQLLKQHAPDIVLHVGLAAGRTYYAVEKSSARTGYARNRDVDGERFEYDESDKAWPSATFPERLTTSLGFEALFQRWVREVKGALGEDAVGGAEEGKVELRPSDDVGSYLCGFIYWTSLAWFWKKGADAGVEEEERERPVVFLHVPQCADEEDLEKGKEVTVGLVRALVDTWVSEKQKEEEKK